MALNVCFQTTKSLWPLSLFDIQQAEYLFIYLNWTEIQDKEQVSKIT